MTDKPARRRNETPGLTQGNRGMGRKKGIPNKLTGAVREMIIEALEGAGGVEYLIVQASKNPAAFLQLVGKVLPLQVGGDPNGAPIGFQEVRRTVVDP